MSAASPPARAVPVGWLSPGGNFISADEVAAQDISTHNLRAVYLASPPAQAVPEGWQVKLLLEYIQTLRQRASFARGFVSDGNKADPTDDHVADAIEAMLSATPPSPKVEPDVVRDALLTARLAIVTWAPIDSDAFTRIVGVIDAALQSPKPGGE